MPLIKRKKRRGHRGECGGEQALRNALCVQISLAFFFHLRAELPWTRDILRWSGVPL